MVGLTILFIAPLIYCLVGMNTGDLLWISPVFNEQPEFIIIHCFGEDITLGPGEANFAGLNGLVNETLTGRKRWDSLTLSESTYQDYRNDPEMMSLEMRYSEAVRIHSRYKFFSNVDTLIIPLVGRHAQTNAIFGRRLDNPAAGSFHVETTPPLVEYLEKQGLCSKP
jgi:hypothetical protein